MPLSFEDINDAIMQGEAKYMEYMQSFESEFMAATEMKQAKIMWNRLPAQIKEMIRQNDPKTYSEIEKMIDNQAGSKE